MIRTTRGRRLPLTALGLVVAAGTAFAGIGPVQAADAPAPAGGSSASAAEVRIGAPTVRGYGFDYSTDANFHGVISVDLGGITDNSGLRYEYQLDGAGPWLSDGTGGVSGDEDEVYIPASPGEHLISVRVAGTVDGVPVTGTASAPTPVRSVGAPRPYTPEVIVDGPSVTFRWDVRAALNGFTPEESDIFHQVDGGAFVDAGGTGSVTVTPGYGKRVSFDLTYGPIPDAWRTAHVEGTTASAPGAKALTSTPPPAIVGTVEYGSTLSVRTGLWQPAPVTLEYQWLRDGERIPGADDPTYAVTAYDAGHRLTVSVRGSRDGYVPVTLTSGQTKKVAAPVITAGTPRVTGNPTVGRTLTAQPGIWKPSSLELGYQWKRDGQVIPGATAKTYTLTAADRGRTVTVVVSGVIYLYDNQARASAGVTVR
ncbi:hypothetical protein [Clavibacter michiganensis]|uniref:Uncharacterized protein n=1 Tax=Clavibacter michiganensis TaxID=28447 RepID=A0A251YHR7_9MICO|nr:hypothetical protein [Clavibacter michiganensis]OUE23805.1 hypothetical protein BFL37_14170 [Clavibacter michiganensis]